MVLLSLAWVRKLCCVDSVDQCFLVWLELLTLGEIRLYSLTIQIIAVEQYFPVVMFIMLLKSAA